MRFLSHVVPCESWIVALLHSCCGDFAFVAPLSSTLLAFKANPLELTDRGETALHLATAAGNLNILRSLIEAKCPVDAKDSLDRVSFDWRF